MKLSFDPVMPLLGIFSEETQNNNSKECMHPYVHFGVIYNNQDIETAQVLISRWVDKRLWYIYTIEYYLTMKNKDILPFGIACMDLMIIMVSEIQEEKHKYHMISLLCRI